MCSRRRSQSTSVRRRPARAFVVVAAAVAIMVVVAGCDRGPAVTPRITPGTSTNPRAVVIVAADFQFSPPVVDLVPGETVVVQVVNGGLAVHETVIGPMPVQDAWEAAEAAVAGGPPGPTPVVSVGPGLEGLRIVVASGERKDVGWTVPVAPTGGPAATDGGWFVGCHIPGHWAEGMVVPVRFVGPDGVPLATLGAASGDTLRTPDQDGASAASR
ncbi:MAG: hypothetical protein EPO36_03610 [Chloroflexota bacterium]|nr:MAG: hypothetical protein EPO36_03610 [Chloroflexota bacterium]